MERKIIYLFLFIFLLTLVSARDYQINQEVPTTKSVRFNGGIVSNATCNITIIVNGTTLAPFKPMTYDAPSQTFNYTLPSSNTTSEGKYQRDITCCVDQTCTIDTDYFDVTLSGETPDGSTTFFQGFMLFLSIGLFALFLTLFIKIDGSDHYNDYDGLILVNWKKYAKYASLVLAFCTFVWINYSAWLISYYYTATDTYSKIFYMMWAIPLRYWYAFLIISFCLFIYQLWGDLINFDQIKRFGEA